ncbi:MAG: hypothetical protein AAF541_05525 [Pseudomonadota bacterium]
MAAIFSIFLAVASAVVTHWSVRNFQGTTRLGLFAFSMALLGLSFVWGNALGGFWPGVYTLISIYFLTTVATPWLHLYWERRDVE